MFKASAVDSPEKKHKDSGTETFGKGLKYPTRLNLCVAPAEHETTCIKLPSYDQPPLFDVTLEEFEQCALDRLRILAEIESCAARGRPWDETKTVIGAQCLKYLPLHATSALRVDRDAERRKDHLGHYILRLAFCRSCVAVYLASRVPLICQLVMI